MEFRPPLLVNLNHLSGLDATCLAADPPRASDELAGKAMQRKTHPDAGGNDEDFQEVQEAIREATQASDKSEA